MSWLSLLFEGAVSILLLVMIAYCVKLNRLLGGLRERDAEIGDLLVRFKEASDRAEASVATLKSVGVEVERSVRTATERAQSVRDELVSLANRGVGRELSPSTGHSASEPSASASGDGAPFRTSDAEGIYPSEFFAAENSDSRGEPREMTQGRARIEAESELLRVIRSARAGG